MSSTPGDPAKGAPPESPAGRYLGLALVAIASAFALWISWKFRDRLIDDVFITLTYAKNLAAGNGFVFNHPPASLGTTTPLLTLMIAALGAALPQLDLDRIAIAVYAVCWVASLWVLYFNRRVFRLASWEAGLVTLVLASATRVHAGSETMLFQMLLVSAIVLYLHQRLVVCGVAVGLLFLTRGEGILLLPLFAVAACFPIGAPATRLLTRSITSTLRVSAGAAMPITAWSVYALYTFGHILPNTLAAKVLQTQRPEIFGDNPGFLESLVSAMLLWDSPSVVLRIGGWVLAAIGVARVLRVNQPILLYAGWMLLYVAGYTLLDVPGWYAWYRIPVYEVWRLLVGLGLITIAGWSATRASVGRSRIPIAAVIAIACMGPRLLVAVNTANESNTDARKPFYQSIANWMNGHAPATASLAAPEVGFLGFYSKHKIIDLAGLISPDHLAMVNTGYRDAIHIRFKPDYMLELLHDKPDSAIPERMVRGGIEYERVEIFHGVWDWAGTTNQTGALYKKVGAASSPQSPAPQPRLQQQSHS